MQVQKVNKQSTIKAVKLLKAGKSVAFPTDTSYGLAVDATNTPAVWRIRKIKARSPKKPIHVVVSSLAMAGKFAVIDKKAKKLAQKFLPGPLTLLLPLRPPLNLPLMRGRNSGGIRLLSAGTGKIGIRIPKNKVALELVTKLKRPITATSANITGKPDCYSAWDINKQFKNKKIKPDLILDGGKLKKVRPSTIIDLTQAKPKLLRKGPVSYREILPTLSSQT